MLLFGWEVEYLLLVLVILKRESCLEKILDGITLFELDLDMIQPLTLME